MKPQEDWVEKVVDYILGADEDSIFANDDRTLDDKYPVSYFPAGIDGLDSQAIRYVDLKGNSAYKTWAKHITNVATERCWIRTY